MALPVRQGDLILPRLMSMASFLLPDLARRVGAIAQTLTEGKTLEAQVALQQLRAELETYSDLGFATTAALERLRLEQSRQIDRLRADHAFEIEQLGYRIDHTRQSRP
jgi:hypothetical protein